MGINLDGFQKVAIRINTGIILTIYKPIWNLNYTPGTVPIQLCVTTALVCTENMRGEKEKKKNCSHFYL